MPISPSISIEAACSSVRRRGVLIAGNCLLGVGFGRRARTLTLRRWHEAGPPIDEQRRELPDQPGVYLFKDAQRRGDLRRQGDLDPQARRRPLLGQVDDRGGGEMIAQIASIDFLVTETEAEALLAEQQFIKRHRPRFNIRLRDDKSYPYIGISLDEEFPRVYFTRERHRSARIYFGPYSIAKRVRETLDLLGRLFQYRTCEGPEPGRRSGVPCLDYYIKRCEAPCVGYVDREEYRRNIDAIVDFLSGRYRDVERDLERKMEEAAGAEEFERAAVFRDRLEAVRSLMERRSGRRRVARDRRPDRGRGRGRRRQRPGLPGPRRDPRRAPRLLPRQRGRARTRPRSPRSSSPSTTRRRPAVPRLIVVGPALRERVELLAEALSARRGGPVEVRVAERGDKRRLRELAAAQRDARPRPGPAAAGAPPRAARRRALRAAGRARARGAAGADRGLRHLQHRRRAHGRLDGRLRGRRAEEGRLPAVPDPRATGAGGPDDFASMEEVLVAPGRAAARAVGPLAARSRARRELRLGPRPDRDRRRQGPALGRDAGAGPAGRARHRA